MDVTVLASLVALWPVFCDNRRGTSGYEVITMTTLPFSVYIHLACHQADIAKCVILAGFSSLAALENAIRWRLRRNRHAFALWITSELLMSSFILLTESFTLILWPCCDTTDWLILTWFYYIFLYSILNITLVNIILTFSFTLSLL